MKNQGVGGWIRVRFHDGTCVHCKRLEDDGEFFVMSGCQIHYAATGRWETTSRYVVASERVESIVAGT